MWLAILAFDHLGVRSVALGLNQANDNKWDTMIKAERGFSLLAQAQSHQRHK